MTVPNAQTYVALLRGINVGGHKKVPMAELRETFKNIGFENVRSVLATGNVIFEAAPEDVNDLLTKITTALEDDFGFPIPVLLRSHSSIEKIIEADPFKAVELGPKTKSYLTFLPRDTSTSLDLPYTAADRSFHILALQDDTIFSMVDLNKAGSPDVMQFLEKAYGKNITTRTWNTVLKIGKA